MSSDSGNGVHDAGSTNNKSNNITRDPMAGKKIVSAIPKKREQLLKWNGWGYKDSRFTVKNRMLAFSGTRYPIGESELPDFTKHILDKFKVDLDVRREAKPMPHEYPVALPCSEFRDALDKCKISHSDIGIDRLVRSHGQTLYDIQMLRELTFQRIPDLVVWPTSHDDVVEIVRAANEYNIVLIPYGGGTSVSGAATCPQDETRVIVALDTTQMNRLLWLDRKNLTACFEAGIIGQDLERELQAIGLTVGHEPDSYEFSSLGGWVATRASGMKKNVYGNIEDIVVRVKMVTSKGVLEKNIAAPRISCGPDFNHVILGSEGTLGVVTEVVLKIRPIPPVKRYGSLAFPDFESGCACMREIAKRRCQPASIRLMDNEQFKFGRGLKAAQTLWAQIIESIKTVVLTKIKGFNMDKISVATLLFEGEAEDVDKQEKLIYNIAKKFGGIPGGATNGERGYVLTFVIAYIRDLALEYHIVAESFETSCPWDRCVSVCTNVRNRVKHECEKLGIKYYLLSYRVTQTYDAGCCIYFYFGYNYVGTADPVETYEYIESMAREEILQSGGSLSHHHGIGKLRSRWYPSTVSNVGVGLYKATKSELDPKNIFAVNNLLPDPNESLHHHEPKSKL